MRRDFLPFMVLALACLAVGLPARARADLLISEMCDPHLNYLTDRFIEIYNTGDEPMDLTNWRLVAVANGVDVLTWQLSGSVDAGEALVAGDATTVIAFPVDFPDENWSNSNGNWNGKVGDGAKLVAPAGTIVDYAVVDATRFENCDYVRDFWVTTPNPTFTPSEWTATPVEIPTEGSPGMHEATPPVHAPDIANIATDPTLPLAGDAVDILADVSDSLAEVTSVRVAWGTNSASLPNEIEMALVSGIVYRTVTPIPSQTAGTTIYFQVEAINDIPGVAVSEVEHYVLASFVTVHAIQGEADASPYAGQTIATSGIVTAGYPSRYVIQEGSGPWDGIWVEIAGGVAIGDSVTVVGIVDESTGNTTLAAAEIAMLVPVERPVVPAAVTVADAGSEAYEGVLVALSSAVCTAWRMPGGEWEAGDASSVIRVDDLGYAFRPVLGARYDIVGPVDYAVGYRVEPRDEADVVWAGDDAGPVVFDAETPGAETVRVVFSETIDPASAADESLYGIEGLTILDACRDTAHPEQVLLTVLGMSPGTSTLVVDGVEDLHGNAVANEAFDFRIVGNDIPAGYYDEAAGLGGETLREALHGIIDDHTVCSYSFAWTAFMTTDDKPNGKVWDIYSDIPYGILPYEYTFGEDQGGTGGEEGSGYTREHAWPKSWFGGEVSPMYSDLFILHPTDAEVNGQRGNYPYGEVTAPTWVSLNGSRVGPCSAPGYEGIVFEPLDEYKGDLARAYFYMSARYYGEDTSWPGSAMTDGAQLLPWALDMMLAWSDADPVSVKEIERNSAVYVYQQNRNPFVDHPEYVRLLFDPSSVPAGQARGDLLVLDPGLPSPFASTTSIRFALPCEGDVRLSVCDANGRRIALLASGHYPAGEASVQWNGRDEAGRKAGSGIYFVLFEAGEQRSVQRLVHIR